MRKLFGVELAETDTLESLNGTGLIAREEEKMSKHTPGPWHIEARIGVKGLTQRGFKVCYGVNSYGDGPKGTVGDIMGASDSNNSLMIAAPDLLALAHQYRDDLRYPPAADSITRRLAAIDAVLAKIGATQ